MIPKWDEPIKELSAEFQQALATNQIPHLRALFLLCRFRYTPGIACWNPEEIKAIYDFFQYYWNDIQETIFHWNLDEFRNLLRTAVELDLYITYS